MLFGLYVAFVSFPSRKDSILTQKDVKSVVEASGSLGLEYDGGCQQTYPNQTLVGDERYDWCSNMASTEEENPWISFYFPNKAIKLTGYALRNGCCRYACCCDPKTGKSIDGYCCCRLYSFSLLGSNDNHTWKTIHKVEEKRDFYYCKFELFEFPQTEAFHFLRIALDKPWKGCPRCLQLNQIEFYGETINSFSGYYDSLSEEENDESISIIGKVKHY